MENQPKDNKADDKKVKTNKNKKSKEEVILRPEILFEELKTEIERFMLNIKVGSNLTDVNNKKLEFVNKIEELFGNKSYKYQCLYNMLYPDSFES